MALSFVTGFDDITQYSFGFEKGLFYGKVCRNNLLGLFFLLLLNND